MLRLRMKAGGAPAWFLSSASTKRQGRYFKDTEYRIAASKKCCNNCCFDPLRLDSMDWILV
jgi:hypothetical protein